MHDFHVDLTEAVRGLVSWMVLTIGLAVIPLPRHLLRYTELRLDPIVNLLGPSPLLPPSKQPPLRHYNLASCRPLHGMEFYGGRPRYRWFYRCSGRGIGSRHCRRFVLCA